MIVTKEVSFGVNGGIEAEVSRCEQQCIAEGVTYVYSALLLLPYSYSDVYRTNSKCQQRVIIEVMHHHTTWCVFFEQTQRSIL